MKKKLITIVMAMLCVLAFTACSSKVTIDDIQSAYTEAGYTASTPTQQASVLNSFGATKGTTIVAVYEFSKESQADTLMSLYNLGGAALNAKFAKKGKVFVCVASNVTSEDDAAAALKIFTDLF